MDIATVMEKAPEVISAALTIVGGAAALAAVFSPSLAAKLGKVGEILHKVVNAFGMNVGAAKNKDAE